MNPSKDKATASRFNFRAWNGKNMAYGTNLVFWNGNCYLNESGTLNDPDHPHKPAKLKGYSVTCVMQSTGLTDKNGIEMWEGDILEGGHVIAWSRGRLIAHYITSHSIKGWDYSDEHETELYNEIATVLGNIYEHPHILPSS